MKCADCGRENVEADVIFCPQCGDVLPTPESEAAAELIAKVIVASARRTKSASERERPRRPERGTKRATKITGKPRQAGTTRTSGTVARTTPARSTSTQRPVQPRASSATTSRTRRSTFSRPAFWFVLLAVAGLAILYNTVARTFLKERFGDGQGDTRTSTAQIQPSLAAFVRSAPSSSADKVAILGQSARLMVACKVQGEQVEYRGITTSEWVYLWSPVEGFMSRALLQSGGHVASVEDCSDPPPRPPVAPQSLGTLIEVTTDGAAIRVEPSPSAPLVVALELGSSVMVPCRASGARAAQDGSTSEEWGRVTQPFQGYISQLNLGLALSVLPSCT